MTDQRTTPVAIHVHSTNVAAATATAQASAGAAEPPKSMGRAYLALLLGWPLALHRFYLGKPKLRWLAFLWFVIWGIFTLLPPGVTLFLPAIFLLPLIDAYRIPGWVRRHNAGRETALAHVASTPLPKALAVPDEAAAAAAPPEPQAGERETRPTRRPELRTRLLRAAHRAGGRLTLTQAVMETEADFEDVETALRALVGAGHVDVDNDPDSGVVLYLFPELVGRPTLRDPEHHG